MSLRKSPTLTPARLEAHRRNAGKSTGPRTSRGKSKSRMNSLRPGNRSALHLNFKELMLNAPPRTVHLVAPALLTPAQAAHLVFLETAEIVRRAEGAAAVMWLELPKWLRHCARRKSHPKFPRAKPECC
jgi:hypothetical protein